MARIIGGVASSHSPTIGFALDSGKQNDPVWAPIFAAYDPIRQWLAEHKPDVLLFIYNDHVTSFFWDHYSRFALGVGDRWEPADEGGGVRHIPGIGGHPKLASHITFSLVADEFDISTFQHRPLDHGCFSPLSMLWSHHEDWPGKIVPLQVGVLQFPIPSAARCYKLGQALRKAIQSYPEDISVAIVATGGLSHQVHGERCGFNNTAWDMRFLELIEKDPALLAQMTIAEYAELGGVEGAEIIMWLIMRGALSASVRKTHQSYYLPTMTGLATAIYEDLGEGMTPEAATRHLAHVNQQLAGAEKLTGSYPFTVDVSVRAFRLNDFLHNLIHPEHRRRLLAEPEVLFAECGLTAEEADMVRTRNWQAMIRYGASFFMLEKLGAVVGVSNLHIYAAMRGQTLEDFMKTRNAPGALYSVAANTKELAWDKK